MILPQSWHTYSLALSLDLICWRKRDLWLFKCFFRSETELNFCLHLFLAHLMTPGSPVSWLCLCCFRCADRSKPLPHSWQVCKKIECTILLCTCILLISLLVNKQPGTSHLSILGCFMCVIRSLGTERVSWQLLKMNFKVAGVSVLCFSLCCLNLAPSLNIFPQWQHVERSSVCALFSCDCRSCILLAE
jgi:hypothetical protein